MHDTPPYTSMNQLIKYHERKEEPSVCVDLWKEHKEEKKKLVCVCVCVLNIQQRQELVTQLCACGR